MTPEEARATDRERLAEVIRDAVRIRPLAPHVRQIHDNGGSVRLTGTEAGQAADAVLDYLAERDQRIKAETLREAASAPELRLRGHSGISVRGLLDRAERIERGEA
ncbi:hypothetical protein [Nocardioides sp. J54]|uniref:hypothetical protein n=1 Tax=Nocardioides sp. J54 TaxID=935866 RepID=UPI00048CF911|nr:hypothetical protein [Nocardioides sp. J54]